MDLIVFLSVGSKLRSRPGFDSTGAFQLAHRIVENRPKLTIPVRGLFLALITGALRSHLTDDPPDSISFITSVKEFIVL